MHDPARPVPIDLSPFLPAAIGPVVDPQRDLPRLARDPRVTSAIDAVLARIPTRHDLFEGDARQMSTGRVQLVVTSPPYWTLKTYRDHPDQLGHVAAYDAFLDGLDEVWRHCFEAIEPGGRLVCVVGDVCLSRRNNGGEHTVIPLHAAIQERCRAIGFSNLAPIIWHKIANARFEAVGNGGGFLGKPYEPNAVIKNDIEFILMLRKPGGYRSPDLARRLLSVIPEAQHRAWFQQIWTGLTGASTRAHPAPYPEELALRLVRMFSFVGDTVLDPFAGTGTTLVAAARSGRNSIGIEVDPSYFAAAISRFRRDIDGLGNVATLHPHPR